MTAALTRVIDAGERFISDRLDLAKVEVSRQVRFGGILAAGAVLALAGWAVIMAAVVLALAPWIAPAWTLGAIGLLHLGGGVGVARWALARLDPGPEAPALAPAALLVPASGRGKDA